MDKCVDYTHTHRSSTIVESAVSELRTADGSADGMLHRMEMQYRRTGQDEEGFRLGGKGSPGGTDQDTVAFGFCLSLRSFLASLLFSPESTTGDRDGKAGAAC